MGSVCVCVCVCMCVVGVTGSALTTHKDRAQVQLDVNRCYKRLPKGECAPPPPLPPSEEWIRSSSFPGMSDKERAEVQEQLVRVIVRLLSEHKGIHYYQGFHDIVVTFLLVVGEDLTFLIMSQLVKYHIK